MISISTKYTKSCDFRAVLTNKNSKLNSIAKIVDAKIAKFLKEKASKNRKGFTFISGVKNSKFENLYFFNVTEKSEEFEYQNLGGSIVNEALILKKNKIELLVDTLPKNLLKEKIIQNIITGMLSKSYKFKNYKVDQNDKNIQKIILVSSNQSLLKKSLHNASNINFGVTQTRNLVSMPANILNPKQFVNEIKKLSKHGLKIEILDEKKLNKIGMNALLGVGQGSSNNSYVAIMKWNGGKRSAKPLSFIGKGVCFDTGGISLKPARFMEEMKYDMAGAGTVVGLMQTLALRKAKVNAVGIVGLVENMPDGNAQRPGDVVKSYSGKTIEIFNTDAEGRLVLADLLSYTEKRFKPKFMINLATLTGAIIISLGNEYAGLFSNNDQLAERINKTSYKDNEKAWRLPLNKNFDRLIDSQIADVQNINYSGGAGSITAAQFLQRFVLDKTPWAHLDIAGMSWTKTSTKTIPAGATGYGVKLLNRLVEEHYE
ncbi:leucyl aminopeptidase [Candidatus Pelagibacter sp. HIMB1517]|uniref:leucyl aminopeptidase n=1 Tax=Candidatus Pelagibacter sp. HIMB1517 TaxID=3413341 RepID=UPI003F86B38C